MIFGKSEFIQIRTEAPFKPILKGNTVRFNKGYLIDYFNVEDGISKAIFPSNIDESFEITNNRKNFFLKVLYDYRTNEVSSCKIVSEREVLAKFDINGIFNIPIASFQENGGSFSLDQWILKENVHWNKKKASYPFKVEKQNESLFFVSGGTIDLGQRIISFDDFQINIPLGSYLGFNIEGYGLDEQSFEITKSDLVTLDSYPQDTSAIFDDNNGWVGPQFATFFPICQVSSFGVLIQYSYGPITVEGLQLVARRGTTSYYNLNVVGNI